MPIYEYYCLRCQKEFEFFKQGEEEPLCPECNHHEAKRLFSVFGVRSKGGKFLSSSSSSSSCSSCLAKSCSTCR